ncbi:MAG: response regulator, partial [Desulfobacterales bacterium]|nr:response regulator [Desulfobacterales bacterium]
MTTRDDLYTIMIVDDTHDNIRILMETLKDTYKLQAATSGERALEMLQSGAHLPDLILLDILMPGIDGYEVCRRLKDNDDTRHIPVIFVTAISEVMDETKGFRLGAVDYITKPFHPPIVKARV